MKGHFIFIAALGLAVIGGCVSPEARIGHVVQRINAADLAPADMKDLLQESAFSLRDHHVSPEALKAYSDETISRLFEATRRVAFYLPESKRCLSMQERVLEEKIRRHIHTKDDLEDMFKTYLEARLFTEAGTLKKRFPDAKFPTGPDTIVYGSTSTEVGWRAFSISEGGRRAELQVLKLGEGPKIVLVMLPGCPVAEKAMTQIMEDSTLVEAFREHGFIVTLRMDSFGVAMWKSHFGFDKVYIVNQAADFPGFNLYASPTFYFLRDGRILDHFIGWGRKDRPDEGKAQMKKWLEVFKAPMKG